ncbi:MAG: AAA family ATPase, partial [Gammaproteobacteria bacterium]|nr:AAA family ATPase [Gammaproteobacteria bacterium]
MSKIVSTTIQKTVAEFVTVASHPTVVRLDDLLAKRPHWISDSYFVTAETKSYLTSMTAALTQNSGCGIFLIGQYGSGKSHFLAYLTQQIRDFQLVPTPLKVVTLSMLNYSANHRMEEIVLDVLGLTAVDDRRDTWQALSLNDESTSGIVLVIDELSEFLRSKPDRAAFNEDIRFLQFMGEWAMDHRFWIIAAMQEQIEHTGDLEYALYRKIKDRYPIRYLLTPTHVQELIA